MPISSKYTVDEFIERWKSSSGSERSNYQQFLAELCDQVGVDRPDPATADNDENAYVFDRPIEANQTDGTHSTKYIDLYKRGCFVCETKQGVEKEEREGLSEGLKLRLQKRRKGHGVRGTKAYDKTMAKARAQADGYIRLLSADEGRPPFTLVIDIGYCIELYSEFTCSGGVYTPFPDARSHRISLNDLRKQETRDLLKQIWTDPLDLDTSKKSAEVTREVANKLARLAKGMESQGHAPQLVAEFLMRCIFTMFSEDVGLLPEKSFSSLLSTLRKSLQTVPLHLRSLWQAMDKGTPYPAEGFIHLDRLKRFNGGLFKDASALPLTEDQLELLIEASEDDWKNVEPAIFGTLLERALDPHERHKLGAHYTPRSYVERLIIPTVIEPLREDWQDITASVAKLNDDGKHDEAVSLVEGFHRKLSKIKVLDPACGSGNFLYVTLEHLKRLEGEVLDVYEQLGGNRLLEMDHVTVTPKQMLGIEINPRAAVIADLVLWIGYLQWQIRTLGKPLENEPILEDVHNIDCRDAILAYDDEQMILGEDGRPKTRWEGRTTKPHPATGKEVPDETAQIPIYEYNNPRPAEWPQADYIVGNPPFIGPARMRDYLGDGYTETIRKTIKAVPESCDYVMYWWNHAANLLHDKKIKRFGFVTTNSLRQTFNCRVVQSHLAHKKPISLKFVVPDHPWVNSTDAAAVRVAMTVGEQGDASGVLKTSLQEISLDEEGYTVVLSDSVGKVQADLTIGADLTSTQSLIANSSISSRGVQLIGSGFIVPTSELELLGFGRRTNTESIIRLYLNGKDLTQKSRNVRAIDLFGYHSQDVQEQFPEIYQWILERVKPERDHNNRKSYREKWWIHGEPRTELRKALAAIPRYIATVETSKHRFFVFLDKSILPDNMLVNIALGDPFHLGVLSSRIHVAWALATGGTLEDRPRYNKTRCFETFPFPDCNDATIERIRKISERLDAFRKERQAEHSDLTMTQMYNVLEVLRSGESLTAKEKSIHDKGLISVLKEIHDELDAAVANAYGWPQDLSNEEILFRLVGLNRERVAEEANGTIRWLRPEFQAPDQPSGVQDELIKDESATKVVPASVKPKTKLAWPKTLPEQVRSLRSTLVSLPAPADLESIAKQFKGARRERVAEILDTLITLGQATETHDHRYSA